MAKFTWIVVVLLQVFLVDVSSAATSGQSINCLALIACGLIHMCIIASYPGLFGKGPGIHCLHLCLIGA